MSGYDATFDMDIATETAVEAGIALIDKYRDVLRGLAGTGRPLILADYYGAFDRSLETFTNHVLREAVSRGASHDEALCVGRAFCEACRARLTEFVEGVRQ